MSKNSFIWREPQLFWGLAVLTSFLVIVSYFDAIKEMMRIWNTQEEYGYGYIIPFITGFLIWQKKNILEISSYNGSWKGIVLLLFGITLLLMGSVSTIYLMQEYGLVLSIMGIFLTRLGNNSFKIVFVPLLFLFFMIPLPVFLLQGLSGKLQLISSELGVAFIRLFDISVFLEGNVIDLGTFQLQVVEACSGLNYLFPLMTLAFICAYFFKGAFWKKAIIFLSSIPITVFMNSFRIGAIGIMVNYWGIAQAEGFLHQFEGWAVFMSCIAILMVEMWLLAKIGADKLPLRQAFGMDFPAPTPADAVIKYRTIPRQFIVSLIILSVVAASVFLLPARKEITPERKPYALFPLKIKNWVGTEGILEKKYLDILKLTDYAMTDYTDQKGDSLNFYSAYYATQRKGASAHSPRSCIPGGGWRITHLANYTVKGAYIDNVPLTVNRLVIEKGDIKQLVYYWFQERGRIITNEYMMKWYIFWDALTRNRTDGALMRLTTVLAPGEDIEKADKILGSFVRDVSPILPEYVPGKNIKTKH